MWNSLIILNDETTGSLYRGSKSKLFGCQILKNQKLIEKWTWVIS